MNRTTSAASMMLKQSGEATSEPKDVSQLVADDDEQNYYTEIACGFDHAAFVARNGYLYSMGSNADGKLGVGQTPQQLRSSHSPQLIAGLQKYKVIHISCGRSHTAAIIDSGDLFTWGDNSEGQLGTKNGHVQNFSCRPERVDMTEIGGNSASHFVVDVSCGSRHTAAVLESGSVCSFGNNESGQLGTGDYSRQMYPSLIESLSMITRVSCGSNHTLFLDEGGRVYSTGANDEGQLGLSNSNRKGIALPEPLSDIEQVFVKKIFASGTQSAVVTDEDALYVFGRTGFGQFDSPELVGNNNDLTMVKEVALGEGFGLALNSHSQVYSFGTNLNGQRGFGDASAAAAAGSSLSKSTNDAAVIPFVSSEHPPPTLVESLVDKRITQISAGGNFVICLGQICKKSIRRRTPSNNSFLNTPMTTRRQQQHPQQQQEGVQNPENAVEEREKSVSGTGIIASGNARGQHPSISIQPSSPVMRANQSGIQLRPHSQNEAPQNYKHSQQYDELQYSIHQKSHTGVDEIPASRVRQQNYDSNSIDSRSQQQQPYQNSSLRKQSNLESFGREVGQKMSASVVNGIRGGGNGRRNDDSYHYGGDSYSQQQQQQLQNRSSNSIQYSLGGNGTMSKDEAAELLTQQQLHSVTQELSRKEELLKAQRIEIDRLHDFYGGKIASCEIDKRQLELELKEARGRSVPSDDTILLSNEIEYLRAQNAALSEEKGKQALTIKQQSTTIAQLTSHNAKLQERVHMHDELSGQTNEKLAQYVAAIQDLESVYREFHALQAESSVKDERIRHLEGQLKRRVQLDHQIAQHQILRSHQNSALGKNSHTEASRNNLSQKTDSSSAMTSYLGGGGGGNGSRTPPRMSPIKSMNAISIDQNQLQQQQQSRSNVKQGNPTIGGGSAVAGNGQTLIAGGLKNNASHLTSVADVVMQQGNHAMVAYENIDRIGAAMKRHQSSHLGSQGVQGIGNSSSISNLSNVSPRRYGEQSQMIQQYQLQQQPLIVSSNSRITSPTQTRRLLDTSYLQDEERQRIVRAAEQNQAYAASAAAAAAAANGAGGQGGMIAAKQLSFLNPKQLARPQQQQLQSSQSIQNFHYHQGDAQEPLARQFFSSKNNSTHNPGMHSQQQQLQQQQQQQQQLLAQQQRSIHGPISAKYPHNLSNISSK